MCRNKCNIHIITIKKNYFLPICKRDLLFTYSAIINFKYSSKNITIKQNNPTVFLTNINTVIYPFQVQLLITSWGVAEFAY